MPTKIRRSRMCRTPTGKRLVLTPRDLTIFRALRQYRYLRSTYLHAFAGGASATRFKERLGDFFHEGYLDRPEEQWRFADSRHAPAIYELGRGAAMILDELGSGVSRPHVLLGQGAHRQFLHSLMVCEILASIELAAQAHENLRFIPLPEILAKASAATRAAEFPLRLSTGEGSCVVPDAMFGLEYRTGTRLSYRFFALEADRGTMPVQRRKGADQTSLVGKFVAYQKLLSRQGHKRHMGIPNLLVLTVTESEKRIETVLGSLNGTPESKGAFLFMSVANRAMPAIRILDSFWKRPTCPKIRLDTVS